MAQQVDGTVDEHPPEVRVLPLKEQIHARLDAHLGTALGQFRELIVGQAVEQADSAKLVGAHHIVTWLPMRQPPGGLAACPEKKLEGPNRRQPQTISGAAHDLGRLRMVRCAAGQRA